MDLLFSFDPVVPIVFNFVPTPSTFSSVCGPGLRILADQLWVFMRSELLHLLDLAQTALHMIAHLWIGQNYSQVHLLFSNFSPTPVLPSEYPSALWILLFSGPLGTSLLPSAPSHTDARTMQGLDLVVVCPHPFKRYFITSCWWLARGRVSVLVIPFMFLWKISEIQKPYCPLFYV